MSRLDKFAQKTNLNISEANKLLEYIDQRNKSLIFIVGAGISMDYPTEAPSGWKLCQRIKRILRDSRYEFESSTNDLGKLYDEFCKYCSNKEGLSEEDGHYFFIDQIDNQYWEYVEPNVNHKYLTMLYHERVVKNIISLNVDSYIEKAEHEYIYADNHTTFNSLEPVVCTECNDFSGDLWKLHGCLEKGAENTIWSAKKLESEEWPALITQSKDNIRSLNADGVIIIGCGTEVQYLIKSLNENSNISNNNIFMVDAKTYNEENIFINKLNINEGRYSDKEATPFLKHIWEERIICLFNKIKRDFNKNYFLGNEDENDCNFNIVTNKLRENPELLTSFLSHVYFSEKNKNKYYIVYGKDEPIQNILDCVFKLLYFINDNNLEVLEVKKTGKILINENIFRIFGQETTDKIRNYLTGDDDVGAYDEDGEDREDNKNENTPLSNKYNIFLNTTKLPGDITRVNKTNHFTETGSAEIIQKYQLERAYETGNYDDLEFASQSG